MEGHRPVNTVQLDEIYFINFPQACLRPEAKRQPQAQNRAPGKIYPKMGYQPGRFGLAYQAEFAILIRHPVGKIPRQGCQPAAFLRKKY
ncbi:hypothetical protein Q31b_29130 [Novipirellula aureliae]|uniref:Uncharacterized protein n=1 Tax=Novipirellula aureliae TaxID=2527966 RepID=A0A5C6DYD8_9BACT|nr:hypothetical protein Q31b_29130 [Novipirellula aureliae]